MDNMESKVAQLTEGKTIQLSSEEIKYVLDETEIETLYISNPQYDHSIESDWLYDVSSVPRYMQ